MNKFDEALELAWDVHEELALADEAPEGKPVGRHWMKAREAHAKLGKILEGMPPLASYEEVTACKS